MGFRLLLFFLLGSVFGCSSIPRAVNDPLFNDHSAQFDIICTNPKANRGFQYFLDASISVVGERKTRIILADKTVINLTNEDCLFERKDDLKEDYGPVQALFRTSCNFGDIRYSNQNLELLTSTKSLNYIRKLGGHVWWLPKNKCRLVEQNRPFGG